MAKHEKSKHFSGTVAHSNMSHHGGKVAGAGELTLGYGPGSLAMKTKVNKTTFGVQGNASGKEKVMKTYNQE